MNQDTVLVDKMVFIKEDFIEKIADIFEVNGIQIFDGEQKYLTPRLIDMRKFLIITIVQIKSIELIL